jgi:hypothetical protein
MVRRRPADDGSTPLARDLARPVHRESRRLTALLDPSNCPAALPAEPAPGPRLARLAGETPPAGRPTLGRGGVLAGHVFVLTLAVAAGVVFELNTARWCVVFLALSAAMSAELFGQVLGSLAVVSLRGEEANSERGAQIAAAMRLCRAAVAVAACGSVGALVAVFTPAVVRALGG